MDVFFRASRRRSFRLATLLFFAPQGAPTPAAEPPRIYAITHATVIPEAGQRIEDGTVVLRDGLIEAVGPGLAVPADAVEIDSRGRWVYPGLIDADSQLGLKADGPERERAEEAEPPAGAVHPLRRIHPEQRARDRLLPFTGERLKELQLRRALGFTTVVATPRQGVLCGSSVAIQLRHEGAVAESILRDDVAQHAAFERGEFGEGYPTSLMGAVAALRQTLLDAARQATWDERYQRDPRGLRRPDQKAAHEALAEVVAGRQALWFTVEDPQDALLADALGRELGIPVVISASGHEWEIAREIAATGRTLILPVAFPDRPDVDDDDEALEVSRRDMLRYLDAPAAAARLHRAGVRFALTTRGLANTTDFAKNMRRIVDAGLPADTALAAWTEVPAKLAGIERMTGSIAAGKIGNVVVTDGPLFEEKTRVRQVFVDGIKHEIEEKEKPKGDPLAKVDPRGDWSVVFVLPDGPVQRSWTLTGKKGRWTGTAETEQGIVRFDAVELAGNVLTVTYPARGGRGSVEVTVVVGGDSFEGVAEMGTRSVPVKGSRTNP